MSSGHQSDSEDADESQGRPDSRDVSDKDEEPGIEDSDVDDDIVPVGSSSPARSSERRTEPIPSSPAAVAAAATTTTTAGEQTADCKLRADPQAASLGVSGTDGRRGNSLFSWLRSRLIRRGVFVDPARDNFRTMTSLYCSMNPAVESVNLSSQTHGAVFNLEYSPDG